MSKLKSGCSLFRLRLSAWFRRRRSQRIDFISITLMLFALKEVRNQERRLYLRAVFCRPWLRPQGSRGAPRPAVLGSCRCWGENLYYSPNAVVAVALQELLLPKPLQETRAARSISHRFHPSSEAKFSPYIREGKPSKPRRPDQTLVGRRNSSLASGGAR